MRFTLVELLVVIAIIGADAWWQLNSWGPITKMV